MQTQMYYSPASDGFYPAAMKARYESHGTWPTDAIAISDAEYAALYAAKEQGETIEMDGNGVPVAVWPLPVPVVPSCTAYQIRQALSALGLRDAAEMAIATSDNQELKDAWQFATNFRRDNPKIIAIAQALNKTDADIDALFQLAKTLSP